MIDPTKYCRSRSSVFHWIVQEIRFVSETTADYRTKKQVAALYCMFAHDNSKKNNEEEDKRDETKGAYCKNIAVYRTSYTSIHV